MKGEEIGYEEKNQCCKSHVTYDAVNGMHVRPGKSGYIQTRSVYIFDKNQR